MKVTDIEVINNLIKQLQQCRTEQGHLVCCENNCMRFYMQHGNYDVDQAHDVIDYLDVVIKCLKEHSCNRSIKKWMMTKCCCINKQHKDWLYEHIIKRNDDTSLHTIHEGQSSLCTMESIKCDELCFVARLYVNKHHNTDREIKDLQIKHVHKICTVSWQHDDVQSCSSSNVNSLRNDITREFRDTVVITKVGFVVQVGLVVALWILMGCILILNVVLHPLLNIILGILLRIGDKYVFGVHIDVGRLANWIIHGVHSLLDYLVPTLELREQHLMWAVDIHWEAINDVYVVAGEVPKIVQQLWRTNARLYAVAIVIIAHWYASICELLQIAVPVEWVLPLLDTIDIRRVDVLLHFSRRPTKRILKGWVLAAIHAAAKRAIMQDECTIVLIEFMRVLQKTKHGKNYNCLTYRFSCPGYTRACCRVARDTKSAVDWASCVLLTIQTGMCATTDGCVCQGKQQVTEFNWLNQVNAARDHHCGETATDI